MKYCGSGATKKVAEMLKFPRKEERKNERKDWEMRGKKGGEEGKEWEKK